MKKLYLLYTFLLFVVSAMAQTITPTNNIIYVKKDATGTATGSSWANAVPELADALKWAKQQNNFTVTNPLQIWVAGGTYKPNYTPEDGKNLSATPADPRNKTFLMVNNVQLYGGFAGTETTLINRDLSITTNASILSGDIGTPNVETDNVYHVVVAVGTVTEKLNTVLNGFSITGAYADNDGYIRVNSRDIYNREGAGMNNCDSNPILTHVAIYNNTISSDSHSLGGGMFNISSNPILTHVAIYNNTISSASAAGGGMYNRFSDTILTHVAIYNNISASSFPTAVSLGGGIFNNSSNLILTQVAIYNNIASSISEANGGGIYLYNSNPILTQVAIHNNTATSFSNKANGGGIYNSGNSNLTLTQVTVASNKAKGSALLSSKGGGISNSSSSPKIYNSIIWGNTVFNGTVNNIETSASFPEFYHSLVQDSGGSGTNWNNAYGIDGAGNIDANPLFTNEASHDYSLANGSPAINVGSNQHWITNVGALTGTEVDLAGNPRFVNVIDIGAFENQCNLTITVTQVNVSCNGGANGTATVNVTGGTGTYTYSWNNGITSTTNQASNLSAGTYGVTVTDANGCEITESFEITEPPVLSVTPSQTNILCNRGSNGSATVNVTGGTGPYTYSWNNGITSTTNQASNLSAGIYSVTVTDTNGCEITESFEITEPTVLRITPSRTNVSCNGGSNGSIIANVTGGTEPYTYYWTNGITSTTNQASNLSAGSYSVSVIDAVGCISSVTLTIRQPTVLSVTPSQTNVSCNGGSNGSASVNVTGETGPYTYSWNNGITSTTNQASNLSAGIYSVTVTDVNGCEITESFEITEPPALRAASSQTNVSCNGGSNGIAIVNVTGGTGTYTYSWNNGITSTTNQAMGLSAGTYSVTVTDANGCTVTQKITITQPNFFTITPSQTNVSCNGGSNGTATVNVTGGTGPYTYSWNTTPAQTTATATNLSAGTYNVTVTDANRCFVTRTFTISQPTVLSVTPSQTNVSCNGGSNGSASVNVTGGTGTYTYSWNNGITSTTNQASNLSAGTYSVTVTDINGCEITESFEITESPALIVASDQGNIRCNGGSTGLASVNVTGGKGPFTYLWDTTPAQTTAAVYNLSAGTYNVTITDANGCEITQSFNITEIRALIITSTQNDVSCNGGSNGSIIVNVTGGLGGYTYSWNNGITSTTNQASNLSAGSYSVTVTDGGGCEMTKTVIINEPALVQSPIASNQDFCIAENKTVGDLVATGTDVKWYSSTTSTTELALTDVLASGSYFATQTLNGCESVDRTEVVVTIHNTPIPSASNQEFCIADNKTVGDLVVTGTAIKWYADATSTNALALTDVLASGSYFATQTLNGCESVTRKEVVVIVSSMEIVVNQTPIICNGDSTGMINVVVTGGLAPYQYHWSNGQSGSTISNLSAGTYTVTITDTKGCEITQDFIVNEPAMVLAPIVNSSVVYSYGDTATALTATADSGNTLLWYTQAIGGIGSNISPTPSTSSLGEQKYWVSQITNDGCESNRSEIVVSIEKAVLTLTVDSGQHKVYGNANPVYSFVITGFKGTDNNSIVTGSLNRIPGENVGTYAITQGNIQAGGNYDINFISADFTISPALLTVVPNSGQSKVYGSVNPTYSYTVTGFVQGDNTSTITGSLSRQVGENVGSYMYLTGSLSSAHNNYAFTILPEHFSITPAPISVVVTLGQKKTFGTTDPVLNYTVSGLVNGDLRSRVFSGSLQREVGENVGFYAITQGTLQTNSNYQLITFTGSQFEIVKAVINGLQLANQTFTYDGQSKSLIVSGNIDSQATISYTGNNQVNVGAYNVVAKVDYGSNYEILELRAVLKIVPADQTINFEIASPIILEETNNFTLNGVASSGLKVNYTYRFIENEPISIDELGNVELLSPGVVEITAHQPGNNNYKAAQSVSRTLVIHSKDSSIWNLHIDDETIVKPTANTFVIKGCDGSLANFVEVRIDTQIGAVVHPSNVIIIPTPDYGRYEQEIEVISPNGAHRQTYKIIIEKRMPSEKVIMQKYDNLVFVNNNPATNGGYKFVRYHWYKNGQKVGDDKVFSEGATTQDLLDPNAEYHAVLYTDNGKIYTTCAIGIQLKHNYSLSVYPNPVTKNQPLQVRFDYPVDEFKITEYTIYSTTGQFVKKGQLEQLVSTIDLPSMLSAGAYIMVMKVNGEYKSVRFIVTP